MSRCAQTDVICFEHSGAPVRYNGTFHSSSDKYKVALSTVENTQDKKSKDILSSTHYPRMSSHQFNLTISCMKNLHRIIQIKVSEAHTERILFEKSYHAPIFSKRRVFLINVENKPAMFVIRIISSEDIIELKKVVPLFEIMESTRSDKKELEILCTDIKNLVKNNTLSDVILTDGDNKMHLHKVILSARSPVFEKMFQCQMKESVEGVVTIKDIPFDVLKIFVIYMYSGDINIESLHMARALYYAADKYDVQNLKKICLSKLQFMQLKDVLDNLILADMYEEIDLKVQALNLIANNFSAIWKHENWNKFRTENQSLVFEILFFHHKKIINKLECYGINILKIDVQNDVQNRKKIYISKLQFMIVNDVLDNLILAYKFDDITLKQQALNFIAITFLTVMEHVNWSKFKTENQSLVFEISTFKLKKLLYKFYATKEIA